MRCTSKRLSKKSSQFLPRFFIFFSPFKRFSFSFFPFSKLRFLVVRLANRCYLSFGRSSAAGKAACGVVFNFKLFFDFEFVITIALTNPNSPSTKFIFPLVSVFFSFSFSPLNTALSQHSGGRRNCFLDGPLLDMLPIPRVVPSARKA